VGAGARGDQHDGHHREHGRSADARRGNRSRADRIAANGDTANKIGTYTVAVLAHEHKIPFYVAAPLSTIDLATPDGDQIPIEERDGREITHIGSSRLTPEGANIRNPAFDVTPHRYIAGIITEKGIVRPPFAEGLRRAFEGSF
jgi:methylthioribose-1-phosphate isomerase